jgi:hypothetical protein
MKTVVYQSFRTERVPGWITTCMATVRSWAESSGFDYRFIDDSFFELAPAWYRERCAGEICPVADLARLVMARDLLRQGYDRTVWLDADMLVFAPQALSVETSEPYAFCFELWAFRDAAGQLQVRRAVNNSITLFSKGNSQLDFFIDTALRIAASQPRVHKLSISSLFLTALAKVMPMPLLNNVGIFSPLLMNDVAGDETLLPAYASELPAPIAAANLCGSLAGQTMEGALADEAAYMTVIDKCLSSRGNVVNRHVRVRGSAA